MKSLFRHKILTLLAGIVTAGVIVFSQLFYFQATTYCQEKVNTEHNQKSDSPESYYSIPSSTISSTSNVEIHQDLSFVLETLFVKEADEESSDAISLPVDKFFQTLFRFIISPNAP